MSALGGMAGGVEQEVAVPEAPGRKNAVLEAINRIFREALSARSEEDLARLCLAVAEDVTGAAFSFMGEVNPETGRLDDLAISERGWRAFTADDPRFPVGKAPKGFAIHGIYGRVLLDGSSLIANDPSSHPDRIGVPDGHPPLSSFLGVPLVVDGATVGMIGLGNRPGGFRAQDRDAVEELAPAIMHALRSKRDEAQLRESRRRLSTLVEGIPQLVWRAVDGGAWTWVSPQWIAYTGLSAARSLGHGWLDALHPDDRAAARGFWEQAGRSGTLEMEGRLWDASRGLFRWFQTRATPVRDEDGQIVEWLGTSTNVDDLRQLQDRQQVLVGELQHRVRNILTVVRSMFNRTIEAGGSPQETADHFKGRLDSLARTQVIVTQSASGLVDLENLIRDELLSVGVSDGPAVTIGGPEVRLTPAAAESIGLAIHELTTNAVKYGALRVPGGRLAIAWSAVANMLYGDERRLKLMWTEEGVPAVPVRPAKSGFGSELIEEALPYRLGAETSLEFRGGGIRCTITMPLPREAWFPGEG